MSNTSYEKTKGALLCLYRGSFSNQKYLQQDNRGICFPAYTFLQASWALCLFYLIPRKIKILKK